jgi:hypothetical protein
MLADADKRIRDVTLNEVERTPRQTFLAMAQKAFRNNHLDKVPSYLDELSGAGFLRRRDDVKVDFVCGRTDKAVTLDGTLDEWSKADIVAIPFKNASGRFAPSSPEALSAQFRFMYDASNLYVAVEVKDDVLLPSSNAAQLWEGDCVELYFNFLDDHGLPNVDTLQPEPGYGPDDMQIAFSSSGVGCNKSYINPVGFHLTGKRAGASTTKTGYVLEIAIPWKSVPLRPLSGYTLGVNVRVLDNDKKGNIHITTLPWKTVDYRYTTGWGRMMLE